MIDKRLMNPEFNPIDDHAILLPRSDEMVRAGQVFVTLFDRAMLAAIAGTRLAASFGPVAQWLEPAAHNGLVAGSSPAGPTIIFPSSTP